MSGLLILGAGGHGRVVADTAAATGRFERIAFLDDHPPQYALPYPILGGCREAERDTADWAFAVAIGDQSTRQALQNYLEGLGKVLPVLVHPSAAIGSRVSMGAGTVVMAGAVINCDAIIGRGCIVNTGSTVDHDCVLEDFVHLSPGTHLGGAVHVSAGSWLGVGSCVVNNCSITSDCMIGAGAVVCRDVTRPGIYIGVPAKRRE